MNKQQFFNETVVSIVVLVLLFFFINPFHFWMPSALAYMILGGVVVVFGVFVALIWKERANDEREEYHKMIAGRIAYIGGVVMLLVGILVETLMHKMPDVWLMIALGVMIIAKILARMYAGVQK